eukprot:2771749-Pyramimonas_sp.AAC.1
MALSWSGFAASSAEHGTALLSMVPPGTPTSLQGNLPGTPVHRRPLAGQHTATGVPDDYRARAAAAVQQVQCHNLPHPSGQRWRPAWSWEPE